MMKKRIMLLMMVAALTVAGFAGCGKKADEPTNSPVTDEKQDVKTDDAGSAGADEGDTAGSEEADTPDTETTPDTAGADTGSDDTASDKPSMADWYTQNEAEFHAIEDSVNAEDMGCKLALSVIDGNVLVFCYTLDEAFPTDEDSVAQLSETYDGMFDSYDATFTELCDQIMSETSEQTVTIRLIAANPDGTELYSRDFTK